MKIMVQTDKKKQQPYKPDSVFNIRQISAISLEYLSLNISIDLPSESDEQPSSPGLHGLSTHKVYPKYTVACIACELLPHIFTLTLRHA